MPVGEAAASGYRVVYAGAWIAILVVAAIVAVVAI
jgi:hypothetical protein